MVCSKEDGDECQPDNASRVHCEPNVLCLIEVGRNLPGLDSVDGAEEDEDHVVDQGQDQGEGGHSTSLNSTEIIVIFPLNLIYFSSVTLQHVSRYLITSL